MDFVKMHACGNDYVYFEKKGQSIDELKELSVRISDRHKGVGSDGIIAIERTDDGIAADIYNSDGSRALNCGNGIRCAAVYAKKYMGINGDPVGVRTLAGKSKVFIGRAGRKTVVTAEMIFPRLIFSSRDLCERLQKTDLYVNERDVFAVDAGNAHAVFFSGLPLSVAVRHALGTAAFKGGVNVECVICTQEGLRAEVFENGSGRTLACGSGAVACAYSAVLSGRAKKDEFIPIAMDGGELLVKICDDKAFLKGEVEEVFRGHYEV
ncbi:MAG: diaminopimelate epimerase [Clostridia bacterium]|nr:diaminopimelate epimerase [Clostridia bacterium]